MVEGCSFIGAFAKVRKATSSFVMIPSVWNDPAATGWIFMKFGIIVFEGLLKEFEFH
jgi:hypothetical protein